MNVRRDHAYLLADGVLQAPQPSRTDALAALAAIPTLRAELDAIERGLTDAARRSGSSWTDIAGVLGLRSRQAAEQRRLRLGAAEAATDPSAVRARRRRQQIVDKSSGTAISMLRVTAANLASALDALPSSPSINLALSTLGLAAEAEPGALIDLVRLALIDLESAQLDPHVLELFARVAAMVEPNRLK